MTRPRDQAAALVDALEAEGAAAVSVPVIEIVDPPDGGAALVAALDSITGGDWLVVTSPNGAQRVAAALGGRSLADGVRVAAVGPATAERASSLGLEVDLVPDDAIAEGLIASFPPPPAGGGRVVLARAETARATLPDALRTAGWAVTDVTAYRTVVVDVDADGRAACAGADAVAFTSGSTVDGLVAAVGVDGLPPIVASIGPATSARAGERNVAVSVEAEVHTIPGVVDALVDHFADRVVLHVEDAATPAAQWCLGRYYDDIDDRFAGGLDRTAILTTAVDEISPPSGLLVIARLAGRPVGCGCLKRTGDGIVDIKRMWLDPDVRGRGLGRSLLDRLVDEARALGMRQVRLETNEALTEAIALYRSAGFDEVAAFNDEPHAHHWFAKEPG